MSDWLNVIWMWKRFASVNNFSLKPNRDQFESHQRLHGQSAARVLEIVHIRRMFFPWSPSLQFLEYKCQYFIYPYTSPALPSHYCIHWTRAQVVGNGFCSSVVEHWSSNPEDEGSIPSRKALELHFSQLVPVWVLHSNFLKHNHDFHL